MNKKSKKEIEVQWENKSPKRKGEKSPQKKGN